MKISLESYQRLYESALSYGLRKTLILTNQKGNMLNSINDYKNMI